MFRYGAHNGDGWPGDWNPERDYTGARYDVAVSGDVAAVAGNFTSIGFNVRRDLAFFRDPTPDTTIAGHIGGTVTSSHIQIFSYSSESGAKFECALDTSTFTACGNGGQSYSDLATGQHTFKVRATDVRGSVDPTPAEYSWTIQDYSNTPDTSWPQVGEGGSEIRAVIGDGNGGWYVGGNFNWLCGSNGCHERKNIAHINADKTVDTWAPEIGPGSSGGIPVRALALNQSTDTLYVGGAFTSVNDDPTKMRLAALDTQTSGHFEWDPDVVAWVYGLQLAPETDTIYVGGTFGVVGTLPVVTLNRLAEIKLDSTADATPWNPNVTGVPGGPGPQVWTIALSDTKLYAGGINIGGAGGQTNTGNLIEIDRATGAASATWRPMPNNAVHALALRSPSASTLFVGGTFTSVGSTAQSRNKAAEINLGHDRHGHRLGPAGRRWRSRDICVRIRARDRPDGRPVDEHSGTSPDAAGADDWLARGAAHVDAEPGLGSLRDGQSGLRPRRRRRLPERGGYSAQVPGLLRTTGLTIRPSFWRREGWGIRHPWRTAIRSWARSTGAPPRPPGCRRRRPCIAIPTPARPSTRRSTPSTRWR